MTHANSSVTPAQATKTHNVVWAVLALGVLIGALVWTVALINFGWRGPGTIRQLTATTTEKAWGEGREMGRGSPLPFAELAKRFSLPYGEVVAVFGNGQSVIRELGETWGISNHYLVYGGPPDLKVGQRILVRPERITPIN